jgi:DNA polymerase-3 subunit delta'
MQVGKYLQDNQKVIYKTFTRSMELDKLSHAYLLIGNPGTPLLDVAKYLAKSLLCDEPDPLACNTCITCLRVEDDNYPDYVVFDGEKETIKKEDIANIESQFEKKAFESKGVRIYILHLVENMSEKVMNALLKFLEEPGSKVYAFLTTNNENGVLPTIVSRCQKLYLKAMDRNLVISEAISFGVSQEDAEFLSFFYNEPNLIYEFVNDKDKYEKYLTAKEGILGMMSALTTSKRELVYTIQKDIIPLIKTKESLRFFIDMLSQIFEDLIAIQVGKNIILKDKEELLYEILKIITKPNDTLLEILRLRSTISLNVNIALLLDHLGYILTKEEK